MLQKSKRLKEILDNSSTPIGGSGINSATGEYISLTAQDVLDDDDLLDEDEVKLFERYLTTNLNIEKAYSLKVEFTRWIF